MTCLEKYGRVNFGVQQEEQVEQEVLFYEEHVKLKCFNIWSNMSDKISYARSYDITPKLTVHEKVCIGPVYCVHSCSYDGELLLV